jgi:hypothetical protein
MMQVEQGGYAPIQVHVELSVLIDNNPQDVMSGNIMLKAKQPTMGELQDEVLIKWYCS